MQEHNITPNKLSIKDGDKITPIFDFSLIEKAGNELQPQDFTNEDKHLIKQTKPLNLFSELQTANKALQDANQMPDPEFLYPILLIENEFTILFADTGIGKTVFATQIGNHIADNGRKVLLLDLELSKKQFEYNTPHFSDR